MNRDREWSVERLSVNAPRVTFYTPPQINGLERIKEKPVWAVSAWCGAPCHVQRPVRL